MKKSLLATVAAVALIAGAGFAQAEGAKDHGMGAAPAAKSDAAPATRNEPAMKQGADIKSGAQLKGRSETNGAGSAEMKTEPKADTKAEGRDKAKPSTTGQADQKSAPSRSSAEEKSSPSKANESGRSATDNKMGGDKMGADNNKMGNDNKSNAAMDSKGGAGASANLTTEQKTKIRTSVLQSSGAPKVSRSSINFNISVGTVVPRSVHFVTVPETIIEIHPAWRGYSYFVVDDEIIIVEPRTLKIIAVLAV